jgi:3-oxoadipate enol-lactonase
MLNIKSSGLMPLESNVELYYQYFAQPESNPALETTLVFIHAHSVDSRMWEPQIVHFTKDYPVLCYDMRGYGKSSFPKEGEDYLHASDLLLLLRRLSIEHVHLVGLSLGSFVALDFYAMYSEHVLSVTVASGGIPDPRPTEFVPLAISVNDFKLKWYSDLIEGTRLNVGSYRERLWEMIEDWQAWQPTHREPECLLRNGLAQRLVQAKLVPVCALLGEGDSDGAKLSVRKLLDCLPQTRLSELQNAGHFCSMEAPDAFNYELRAFLKSVD